VAKLGEERGTRLLQLQYNFECGNSEQANPFLEEVFIEKSSHDINCFRQRA
jgi:hypothetical protein